MCTLHVFPTYTKVNSFQKRSTNWGDAVVKAVRLLYLYFFFANRRWSGVVRNGYPSTRLVWRMQHMNTFHWKKRKHRSNVYVDVALASVEGFHISNWSTFLCDESVKLVGDGGRGGDLLYFTGLDSLFSTQRESRPVKWNWPLPPECWRQRMLLWATICAPEAGVGMIYL